MDDRASGSTMVAVLQTLRERSAKYPKDKAFGLDGILKRLGFSPQIIGYEARDGVVFQRLLVAFLRRYPAMINLLVDGEPTPLDGSPSWVLDWAMVAEKAWLPARSIYHLIRDIGESAGIETYPTSQA
jgi:hypothetical protein